MEKGKGEEGKIEREKVKVKGGMEEGKGKEGKVERGKGETVEGKEKREREREIGKE